MKTILQEPHATPSSVDPEEPPRVDDAPATVTPDDTTRPLFLSPVPAGFPSPADDYIEQRLDLNDHLVRNPAATFFVRVSGDSMIGAGIHSDDILVVDRSLEPKDGRVVIAVLDGDLTVKRLRRKNGRVVLMPENDRYKPITIANETQLEIWGVVTAVIHAL